MSDIKKEPAKTKTCKYCNVTYEVKYLKTDKTGKMLYTDMQGRWIHGAKCPDCVGKRYEKVRKCTVCDTEYTTKQHDSFKYCSAVCKVKAEILKRDAKV